MIPWYKLFRAAGGVVGERMGGRVARDIKVNQQYLNQESAKKWVNQFESEHKKDIHDLVTKDSEVSAHWLHTLIDKSKEPGDLNEVLRYLHDGSKTLNLTRSEKSRLFVKATSKIESIKEHELMAKFMSFLKEHGDDLF